MTAGVVVFVCIRLACIIAYALPLFRKIQSLTGNINHIARENLNGLLAAPACHAESCQEQKFE